MRKFILKQLLFLCAFVVSATAQTLTHSGVFNHLGALETEEELAFVKNRIDAGAEPWASEFAQIRTQAGPGTGGVSDGNGGADNAAKAYANAIVWHYTGLTQYADNAIAILNEWANTFNGYAVAPKSQPLLVAAWTGSLLGPAAELMRKYTGWSPAAQAKMKAMFIKSFYPALNLMSEWNGNVDLTQIDAMLGIATFNEDKAEFDAGIIRFQKRSPAYFYLKSDAPSVRIYATITDADWSNPNPVTLWTDGLTQETCRDNTHHAQFAIAAALAAAEIAWHQGVDLYADQAKRYIAAIELMSLQLRTGKMQGTCGNNNTNTDRYNTLEIGYNHYHNRMGVTMPETEAYLATTGSKNGQNQFNIFYETLTHHGLIIKKDPPTAITVTPNPLTVPLNGTATATAVVEPLATTSQNVTWKSSDPSIATVSTKGVVTGVAIGTAIITATTEDGTLFNTSACSVKQISVTGVSIDPVTVSLVQGLTSQLKPVFTPINVSNTNVTWKSSDVKVASISTTGVVTAVATGTVTITITTEDGGFTANSIVTVIPNPKLLMVSKTAVAPIIDGAPDESMWDLNKTIAKAVVGTANNTLETFGALWDDTYLYIGVKVLDGTITNNPANAAYNNDAIELYFDMNNNGGVYDASDRHWTYVVNGTTISESTNQSVGVKFATKTIVGGYTMEFAIPWSNFNITPSTTPVYGFDIAVDDADGGTRINQNVWMGDANDWQDLSNVGDLKLLNPTIIPVTITQDIQLVQGWNLISTNIYPTDSSIATLFKTLDVLEIKTADAFWSKGQNIAFNSLNAITSGQAYLVNMNAAGKLSVTGTATATANFQYPTTAGWHLVGCPFQTATTIATQITPTSTTTYVKNFEGFWTPNGVNSITNIEPGKGYFLKK